MKQRTGSRDLWLVVALGIVAIAVAVAYNLAPTPPPPPVPTPAVALAPIEVIGVGELNQGRTSADDLLIRITELDNAAIPRGPGQFELVLTDSAGAATAVSFAGTPTLTAPGSLGVIATLSGSNVLRLEIVDSDPLNIEQVTIEGLAISASTSAPLGALALTVAGCTGSLAGCAANTDLDSPGTVIAPS